MKNVSEQNVEHALDFLRDNAKDCAKARADMVFLDNMRKAVHAQAAADSPKDTQAEKERDGYRSAEYKEILEQHRDAVFRYQYLQGQLKAAELKIEVWRSLNKYRGMGHV